MRHFSTPLYDIDDETQAVRVEFNYRVPCWHCGKTLCNKDGKPNPPLVGYRVHIHGAPRVLHRTCVESLAVKIK